MRKLLILLCLTSLAFAGCGGGDDESSDTGSGSGAAGTSESGSDAADDADTDFSGKGSGDFCDLARKYEEDFDDTGNTESAADVEKEYKELASAIDNLVDEAPSEI